MYVGGLDEKEKEELLDELRKEKNGNLLKMAVMLYQADHFIMVTNKACCMMGKMTDMAVLFAKAIDRLLAQCPESKNAWAKVLRDMADDIENADIEEIKNGGK